MQELQRQLPAVRCHVGVIVLELNCTTAAAEVNVSRSRFNIHQSKNNMKRSHQQPHITIRLSVARAEASPSIYTVCACRGRANNWKRLWEQSGGLALMMHVVLGLILTPKLVSIRPG
jgi:hypothetical protein